jgi:hypothetical protein
MTGIIEHHEAAGFADAIVGFICAGGVARVVEGAWPGLFHGQF